MNKELFEKYAKLKRQEKVTKVELEFLQPEILKQALEAIGDSKAGLELKDVGTFSIVNRKTWHYSKAVESLEKQLDDQKKKEQRTTATFETIPGIMFKEKPE